MTEGGPRGAGVRAADPAQRGGPDGSRGRGPAPGSGPAWRTDLVRWFAFSLVCAGGSLGLGWLGPVVPLPAPLRGVGLLVACLVLPLASVLVPLLTLRRVPRRKRRMAWQLIVPVLAGAFLGVFGRAAGDQAAITDRGQWTRAVVVSVDLTKTNHCELRTTGGRDISPSLSEGEGCTDAVSEGDELRVRYDPEGAASPTAHARTSSYGFLGPVFLAAVAMGTWGGVRQSRWDREYDGS